MTDNLQSTVDEKYQPRHIKKSRSGRILGIVFGSIALLFGVAAAVVGALVYFGVIGASSDDFSGPGTESVQVTINEGDYGDVIAQTLVDAGVTKTFDCFYNLLLETKPEPVFTPGVYQLKKQMSAQGALDALLDPANRVELKVTIPEGTTEKKAFAILSQDLGLPLSDFEKVAANPAQFGLPAQATSLEGFLYPATYNFDPGVTAEQVITRMVEETFAVLDEVGVPQDQQWETIVLASVIQRESSSIPGDAAKISRVFHNRMAAGMNLGSDVTVCYGAGLEGKDCVEITQAALDDASNLYNTRVLTGLPIGPISNPGKVAIDAAYHPAEGSWLFFCTVNLSTGETIFSDTVEEHNIAVEQMNEWLAANPNAY